MAEDNWRNRAAVLSENEKYGDETSETGKETTTRQNDPDAAKQSSAKPSIVDPNEKNKSKIELIKLTENNINVNFLFPVCVKIGEVKLVQQRHLHESSTGTSNFI